MADFCPKINADILKFAISKEHEVEETKIEIDKILMMAGAKKGDGFSSDITAVNFRANFDGKTVDKNYIAKYSLPGPREDLMIKLLAYEREELAYNFLIPKLNHIRNSRGLQSLPFAKCLYSSVEERIIILENKKFQKFQLVEKKPEPLNLESIKLALSELASFHATGHHFIKTYPGGENALRDSHPVMFNRHFISGTSTGREIMRDFLKLGSKMFCACIKIIDKYCCKSLAEKMTTFSEKIMESVDEFLEQEWDLCSIVHGDAWHSNFLYRFQDNDLTKPLEIVFIDLQGIQLGRLGVELSYFFYSNTSTRQRKTHFIQLIKFYYQRYFEELRLLGDESEPHFSFEQLLHEIDLCKTYGFILGFVHAQILLFNEDSSVNFTLEEMDNEVSSNKMVSAIEAELVSMAESNLEFRNFVFELSKEAELKGLF